MSKPNAIASRIAELRHELDGMSTEEIATELLHRGVTIPEQKLGSTPWRRQLRTITNAMQGLKTRGVFFSRKRCGGDEYKTVIWYINDRPPQKKLMDTIGPRTTEPDPPSPVPRQPPVVTAKKHKPAPSGTVQIQIKLSAEEATLMRDMLRKLAPLMAEDIAEKLMVLYFEFLAAVGDTA